MDQAVKLLCGFKNRPGLLVALALALLLLLFLLREWLWGLFLLYLAALVFLGLIGGMRLAQAILRKLCWKVGADRREPAKDIRTRGIDIPRTLTSGPTR